MEKTEQTQEITQKKISFYDLPFFRFFLNSKNGTQLLLKILLLVAIPVVYPFVCGLVIEEWLHIYSLRGVIAIILLILYVLNLTLIVLALIRYFKGKRAEQ